MIPEGWFHELQLKSLKRVDFEKGKSQQHDSNPGPILIPHISQASTTTVFLSKERFYSYSSHSLKSKKKIDFPPSLTDLMSNLLGHVIYKNDFCLHQNNMLRR